MDAKKIILRNVFSNWGYYVIAVIIGIFMMPFMVHRLGSKVYGFWILILSVTGYMGLFDLGVRGSIVKFISEFHAKNDYESLNKVASTSYVFQFTMGILVIVLSIIFSSFFSCFFTIRSDYLIGIKITVILLGLNIAFTLFGGIFSGILDACKRTDIISAIESISLILQTILLVACILAGYGIVALGSIILFVNIIKQLVRYRYAVSVLPGIIISMRFVNAKTLKMIFGYGLYIFVIGLSSNLIFRTDNIVIGIIFGASAITSYNVGLRLIDYYSTIHVFLTGVLVPFASEYDAHADKNRLAMLFISGTKYSYMLTGLIAPILIFSGKRIINLWMGPEFVSNYFILFALLVPYILIPSYFVVGPILKGIGCLRFYTAVIIMEGSINLILSIFLAKRVGLIGVALGTAIPHIFFHGIILIPYVLRMMGINLRTYLKTAVFPILVPAFILAITLVGFAKYTSKGNILWFLIELLVSLLVYISAIFYLSSTKGEKSFYVERLRSTLTLICPIGVVKEEVYK